jgi:hypothetical protein
MVLRLRGRALVLAAVGVTWLAWSAKLELGVQGLYDLTWAVFLATAAVLLLAGAADRRTVLIGAVFAGVAALTKTEAQVAGLLLAGLTLVRHRHAWRRAMPALVAVVGGIGLWSLIIRPSADERGHWSKLTDLVHAHSEVRDRLGQSVHAFRHELGPMVLAGVVLVVAILVLARWAKLDLQQPGLVSLLVLALGYLVFTILTFTVRPETIDFLLSVTAYRTAVFIRLVVMIDVVLASVAAARAVAAPITTSHDRAPDPTTLSAGSSANSEDVAASSP